MKTPAHKTERLHSLDSLRAIMMLLGLVLHAAITYGTVDYGDGWSLKAPGSTHLFNDVIVLIIHSFRMQIFFLVAGFFGAMLFYERQPLKMIKNRVSRIVLPFIVFVILLWPTIVFTFSYTELIFNGNENTLDTVLSYFSNPMIFIPQATFHLWFLYYLSLITFASVGLGFLFKKLPKLSNRISKAFNWILKKTIVRLIVFTVITGLIYASIGTYEVETSNSFIPNLNTFIYYLFFYLVGWILFKSKHLLDTMMQADWICTILGLILVVIYYTMLASFSYEVHIILKSFILWLFIFGITGLFIRYGSNHSARMRYISDASYWVYLLHLSLTAILPGLIVDWPMHAIVKFLFVLISTGIICFVSYHYLVRNTFIGKFLNGRKYSKKLSDIRETEELSKLKTILDK